ncbi:MAG: hypothetical protein ACLTWE_16305 [Dysgonomonas mossii]|uniref:hypothetical protein n=1 Tax=Dysgonomonas mossii TaxID=163665 RepID=UPI003991C78F
MLASKLTDSIEWKMIITISNITIVYIHLSLISKLPFNMKFRIRVSLYSDYAKLEALNELK